MKKKLLELLNDSKYSLSFSITDELSIAGKTGYTLNQVEDTALERGIVPLRYQRNMGAINIYEQRKLLHSRVGVIGCGGLGGFVIEELARLGIGEISAWDYDYFQEHNLNRQLMSEFRLIGHSKIEAVSRRVRRINPGIEFNGMYREFNEKEDKELLNKMQVIVDALDSVQARLELSRACRNYGIPMVHGAVNTWYGQVSTQFPGEDVIEQIYAGKEKYRLDERSVLVFTASLVASLQAAEVLKIILNRGNLLRQKIMLVDMLSMDMEIIDIPKND